MQGLKRWEWVTVILIVALAAGWKFYLLSLNAFPFNSDEAIVALMARHALMGQIPIFFYGQAYMGSLDALFVAAVFSVIGQKIIGIRILQIILYSITIITTVEIGRVGFKSIKVGITAAAFLAIPAVNTTLYSTISLGGYGEALAIGNLILLTGIHLQRRLENGQHGQASWMLAAVLGFLSGMGLWADGLTLVFSVPVISLILITGVIKRKAFSWNILTSQLGILMGGIIFGAMPWWIFAAQNGLGLLTSELLGTAVNVGQTALAQQLLSRTINFLLLGMTAVLGFRPPWSITWLALPLIPFVLLFWGWVGAGTLKKIFLRNPIQPLYLCLAGIVLTLVAGFIGTPFGNDPSGRYFLPLIVPFALAAADLLAETFSKTRWIAAAAMGMMLFNGIGTMQCALVNPPGITTQFDAVTVIDHSYDETLISFLKEQHESYGYANYWVAYPLAFKSEEQLIYIPRLPYHQDFRYTSRDDRYEPYREAVNQAARVAYITTHHEELNQYLRNAFTQKGINWKENRIGDYQIFYQLSRPISPEEIGLGDASKP